MNDWKLYFDERLSSGLLGNSWERWAATLSVAIAVLVLAYVVKGFLAARLRKQAAHTPAKWDDMALIAVEHTGFAFFLVLALHFGTQGLALPAKVVTARDYVFFFFLFWQIGLWLTSSLQFAGDSYRTDNVAKEPGKATMVSTIVVLGNVVIWITMGLMLLSNYGVNISALVAGLGIGGVAVALALQNILGDLFASLSIVLDKPFAIGDHIDVNGFTGTVEHIGLKTTRIRSTSGEQLIFGNADLLKNVMRNYKRMERRRVVFAFGLTYETPTEKLHRARTLVKEIVGKSKNASFDRCHLKTFAASSLDYELVYWIESSDLHAYMDTHHEILVNVLAAFGREGMEFAYPHQVQLDKFPHAKA